MSKFDDKQQDQTVITSSLSTTQIHVPAGAIPAIGPDAPNVHPKAVGFSGGLQITPVSKTAANVRFANPS